MIRNLKPEASSRFLIVRLSAIGDCILTTPLLTALRESFPDARIGWVTQPAAAELLRDHSDLDDLIVVPKGWMKSPVRLWQVRRQVRAFRPDVVLDPQSLLKSSLIGWLSGAKRRIGFAPPLGRELAPYLQTDVVQPGSEHIVDHHRELLTALGIEPTSPVEFKIPVPGPEQMEIQRWLRTERLSRFAVINPGAGWDSRLWVPDRFAAVARGLQQKWALRTVVTWAGDREREWARGIVAGSAGAALLAPSTSLRQLAALLAAGECFIGCDTGPLHLAVAMGTPSVALHGTTLPTRSGPYGPRHVTIQKYFQDGTSRQRRGADNDAMRRITVEDVIGGCETLWRKAA